ncbi:MAG: hypothetical protein B0A82_07345 [Alkalinema sp. CACIAM 70d]|nr:MAG: hypothetical protein B0A82_07345 [Alkalinema sp. CACIAM 70d]
MTGSEILGLAGAVDKDGILLQVYKDLAQPGVQQVGRSLGTVIELTSHLLMPLRLANETIRHFEKRKFEQISDRFSQIPDEEIVEVSPEIGVPILEKLSITDDETLRSMFVELLAKAASKSQVRHAHPSFSGFISSISPDEALLIRYFRNKRYLPIVNIVAKTTNGSGHSSLMDLIIVPPEDILFPENIPLYISNLSGLGILQIRRGDRLTAPNAYDSVKKYCEDKYKFPNIIKAPDGDRKLDYEENLLEILPLGLEFIKATSP